MGNQTEVYREVSYLDHCPRCGGPADNGNDRMVPPNPYNCTKCEKEIIERGMKGEYGKIKLEKPK